jgi:peptidoglycan/xylan/chitin deacetylase (PgdA/CDA1 family)
MWAKPKNLKDEALSADHHSCIYYYYLIKPLIPRTVQIFLRRKLVRYQMEKYKDIWPIDEKAGKAPQGWSGWPDGKKFALVLTHDVDTAVGHERCLDLAMLEEQLGFRSSFNFVPLRYNVSAEVRSKLEQRGFEIGLHGLYHDGQYYRSKEIFRERAHKINEYLKEWKCAGYRAPSMYHKLDWFHELNIQYDASTFDSDPFEPYSKGVGTIFPFIVTCDDPKHSYVELPYTLPQDYTLFILMQKNTIDLWKRKLEWVVKHGGVVLMNTHPDYMNFTGTKNRIEEYPACFYQEILMHIQSNYAGQYWHVLPKELARFWRNNHKGN